jgi:bisphosphoglycerate-dependent phosphoglycerate mutase
MGLITYQRYAIVKSTNGLDFSTYDSMISLTKQAIRSSVALETDDEKFFTILKEFREHINQLESEREREIAQQKKLNDLIASGLSQREASFKVFNSFTSDWEDEEM